MWSPFFPFSQWWGCVKHLCFGWVCVCSGVCLCHWVGCLCFYLTAPVFMPTATLANHNHLPVSFWQLSHQRRAHHNYLPFDLVTICPSLFLILSVVRFMAKSNTSSQGTQLFCVKLSHRFLTDSPHMGPGLKRVLEREKNQYPNGKVVMASLSLSPPPLPLSSLIHFSAH